MGNTDSLSRTSFLGLRLGPWTTIGPKVVKRLCNGPVEAIPISDVIRKGIRTCLALLLQKAIGKTIIHTFGLDLTHTFISCPNSFFHSDS